MSLITSMASGRSRVEHPRVEAGVLLGGERVHLAADGVERATEISIAARRRVPLNSRCSR